MVLVGIRKQGEIILSGIYSKMVHINWKINKLLCTGALDVLAKNAYSVFKPL
jgi:hypothetical protein